jgi:hypothetical protein
MNIAHESGKRLNAIGVFLRGRDMEAPSKRCSNA